MVTVETVGDGVKGSQTQENKPMVFSFREGENTDQGLERGLLAARMERKSDRVDTGNKSTVGGCWRRLFVHSRTLRHEIITQK